MKTLSLYTPPFSETTSYFDVIDIAKEYGLSHVETINAMEIGPADVEAAKRLREHADKQGITFTCCSFAVNLVGDDRDWAIQYTKDYVDVVKALGSPYFHHTIAMDTYKPGTRELKEDFEVFYKRGIEAVREIYDYAAERGIRTIFEDQGAIFNGCDNFGRFLNEVNRDVGVVADFGNIVFVDDDPVKFINLCGDKIVNVHVKDYKMTINPNREKVQGESVTRAGNYAMDCPFGEGDIDLKACFEALEKFGYNGNFAIECQPLPGDQRAIFKHNIEFCRQYVK